MIDTPETEPGAAVHDVPAAALAAAPPDAVHGDAVDAVDGTDDLVEDVSIDGMCGVY